MRNIALALATFSALAACDTDNVIYDPINADRARVWRAERACIDLGEPIAWTAVQYSYGALSWFVVWTAKHPYGLHPSVQFVGYRGDTL